MTQDKELKNLDAVKKCAQQLFDVLRQAPVKQSDENPAVHKVGFTNKTQNPVIAEINPDVIQAAIMVVQRRFQDFGFHQNDSNGNMEATDTCFDYKTSEAGILSFSVSCQADVKKLREKILSPKGFDIDSLCQWTLRDIALEEKQHTGQPAHAASGGMPQP